MINQTTYNQIISRFEAFANGHYLINQFTHGSLQEMIEHLPESGYPLMHIELTSVEYGAGIRSFRFTIIIADIPRDKEVANQYQKEAISDMIQIGEDLIAEIRNGGVIFGNEVESDENVIFSPFIASYTHTLAGVSLDLTLTFPYNWNACDIPADWSIQGSGSYPAGGGGGALLLKVNGTPNIIQNILNLVDGDNITIEDLGNGSVRISSSGGGAGASWGAITGILSNQLDLQAALDLKADISSLSAVAFSGSYLDLIDTPSIPSLISVGLQAPAPANPAFSVSNSPITTSGDIILSANGNDTQYIDGKGALRLFPSIPKVLSDLIAGSQKGDMISWDGSKWEVIPRLSLDDLNDVNAASPSDQMILRYNAIANRWDAVAISIPPAQVNSDWNANSGVAQILNKPSLAAVATSGDYADLINTPSIPQNLNDLSDVNTSTAAADDLLTYDGSQWEPITPKDFGAKLALDNLSDVDVINPQAGEVITWDAVNNVFTNLPPVVEDLQSTLNAGSNLTADFGILGNQLNVLEFYEHGRIKISANDGNGVAYYQAKAGFLNSEITSEIKTSSPYSAREIGIRIEGDFQGSGDKIKIITPEVVDQNAIQGALLTLIDPTNGATEWVNRPDPQSVNIAIQAYLKYPLEIQFAVNEEWTRIGYNGGFQNCWETIFGNSGNLGEFNDTSGDLRFTNNSQNHQRCTIWIDLQFSKAANHEFEIGVSKVIGSVVNDGDIIPQSRRSYHFDGNGIIKGTANFSFILDMEISDAFALYIRNMDDTTMAEIKYGSVIVHSNYYQ